MDESAGPGHRGGRLVKLERGLWPEALVAAVATLTVSWPLTTLLQTQPWLTPAIVLIAAVAVSGAALRTVRAAPSAVSLGQLAVGLVGLSVLFLPGTLWYGLPTPTTARAAADLLAEAGVVLSTYAAPAPTTPGVTFLVVSVLVLTAVSVDTIGVTGRAPAVAGIPLASAFLVSVSNSGQAMAPWFFLSTAAAWLLMMVQQGEQVLEAWPSRGRREFRTGDDVTHGRTGNRSAARLLGAGALLAALVGAGLMPHLPPTYFGDGLARNPDANDLGDGGGEVDFVDTMDPSQDLLSQSDATVLRYTATARVLEPLKVTATEVYDDGAWQPPTRRRTEMVERFVQNADSTSALSADVQVTVESIQVSVNSLQPPHIATPAPLTYLDVDGAPWLYDIRIDAATLSGRPVERYRAGYASLRPMDQLPEGIGSLLVQPPLSSPALLEVPREELPAVSEVARQVVAEETRPLQQAIAIQNYLRSSPFVYSLTLAEDDPSVVDAPISQFLANKQGYCVQFATSMVMMARSQGIPSRMAVGFLPGELQDGGVRTVVAADAHTWPELFLDGLGWTRFEPTPGARSGLAPGFTRAGDQLVPQEIPTPTAVAEPEPVQEPPQSEGSSADVLRQVLVRAGWVLLGLVVLGMLMMVVPVAGRWYRGREARGAQTPRDQVEAQWLLMTRSLSDLGVPTPPVRSPREMRRHYTDHTDLDRRGEEALDRVTRTLEQTRYAAPLQQDLDRRELERDVGTVIERVREAAPGAARAKALLVPGTGWVGLRSWVRMRR